MWRNSEYLPQKGWQIFNGLNGVKFLKKKKKMMMMTIIIIIIIIIIMAYVPIHSRNTTLL